jgi:hypothetical protein
MRLHEMVIISAFALAPALRAQRPGRLEGEVTDSLDAKR